MVNGYSIENGGFIMKNLLSMADLTVGEIDILLKDAEAFLNGENWKPKEQTFIANLFFEASTRTKFSFEVAEKKLALDVLNFESSTSSTQKGESLYDTVKTLEALGAKAAVIRHKDNYFYDELVGKVNIPIINAGAGSGQHPTQSLLDLLTIKQEFQTFKGITVAIVGDIRHSRVAHSNAEALSRLGASVVYSGPKEWQDDLTSYMSLDDAVKVADVMMMLRIQHERHDGIAAFNINEYHKKYGLTVDREKKMKEKSIIMHPAPVNRGVEIANDLVECERSRIFKQVSNGVAVRMAVLKNVIEDTNGGYKRGFNYKERNAV